MKRTTTKLTLVSALLNLVVAGALSVYAAEDSWASKAPMQQARGCLGVAVVNGKIYAIGGVSSNGFCATNEEYDPTANTWAFKAPMPTPRSVFGIAVYQNKIYCIGGYTNGFSATGVNEVYDPVTDTWETKASMPTPSLNLQANVVNGKIYLIGGIPNGTLNQVYDPASDIWSTKASVPSAVSSYASAVVDNKIYVITSNLTQIYDVENDSWSRGAPAPLPAVLGTAGATTGVNAPKRVYVFGADANTLFWQVTTRNFTAQSYDPETDNWTVCASMQTGRYSAGVAVVDELLYVIGGFTIEFPTDRFTLNPSYHFKAVNEQYTPFGYGTVLPIISVVSPENQTYNATIVSLVFIVNKPVAWMRYSLDRQDNVTITGNTTIAGLSNGLHTITVYANDTCGNIGVSKTIQFIIDQPEPFPTTWFIASLMLVAVIGIGSTVYFKKQRH